MKQRSREDRERDEYFGGIPTTRKAIWQYLGLNDSDIVKNTVFCLANRPNHSEYDMRLIHVCTQLHFISTFYYYSGREVEKLTARKYDQRIFEGLSENADEIQTILERIHACETSLSFAGEVFKKMILIRHLWCHMIASTCERVFISELAYAFEYVAQCEHELPEPLFLSDGDIFPHNYQNYNYWKSRFWGFFENL